MMVWLQIIFFIIQNAPTLIKAIRDIIAAFDGDRKMARDMLHDMQRAAQGKSTGSEDLEKALHEVIEHYKKKAAS